MKERVINDVACLNIFLFTLKLYGAVLGFNYRNFVIFVFLSP